MQCLGGGVVQSVAAQRGENVAGGAQQLNIEGGQSLVGEQWTKEMRRTRTR